MILKHAELQNESAVKAEERFVEFDSVRLIEDVPASAGVMWLYDDIVADAIVAGATGAIVDVYGDNGPFMVEFTNPVPALVTVTRGQIVRL